MKKLDTYDLKIGMRCNNNCIHCVVANRKEMAKRTPDMKYGDVIRHLRSIHIENYRYIVITGGEPTTFEYFGRLLKYLAKTYPDLGIAVQTNGRHLKDFVQDIKDTYAMTDNLAFAIAIHADTPELHDKITNVPNSKSFQQTTESIKLLLDELGDKFYWRSETVLSNYNVDRIAQIAESVISMNGRHVGISYPHLDGYMYENPQGRTVTDIGFDYDRLKAQLPKLTKVIKDNPDVLFSLEEFPPCLWLDGDNFCFPTLKNVHITNFDNRIGTAMSFMGKKEDLPFEESFRLSRRKYERCKECSYNNFCNGIWQESFETFKNEALQPIPEKYAPNSTDIEECGCC